MLKIKACVDVLLPPDLHAEADRLAIQENWANQGPERPTRFWRPGRMLRIRFLGGEPQLQRRVLDAAGACLQYANLAIEPSTDTDAEIRISFIPGATWSYIGTDALVVPWDQATANFGWLRRGTASQVLQTAVLHVFGHILGLAHEHQSPPSPITWDRAAVYDYYAALPTPWTPEQVDRHLFAAYSQDVTQYAAFDPASIMTLPIPQDFTQGSFAVTWPAELCETDIEFIAWHYPYVAQIGPTWSEDDIMPMVDDNQHRDIPRNGGGTPGSGEPKGVLDHPSGGGAVSFHIPGEPTDRGDAVARSIQPATLRLDVAVPEQAQVGRAFRIAVAVRQPSSPTLVAAGLPVVQSGEAQVVWLSEPFLRLRIEVSAPECTFDGPNSKTFRLFPQVDSPVFYFNLTPKVIGTINIVVDLYQEEDTLGSAGTNTVVSDQPVGDVTLKLESSAIASRPVPSGTLDGELAAARGALAGVLAQIYFEQASIKRITIECGLDPSRIAFDNRADNSWSDLMREAVLQDRVEAIIAKASKEYPAAADLQTAIVAYRQALA
jgi:hypothetical protein